MRACQLKWDEMMGKSPIHLHLLVSRSSGRRVIIYRAPDNWQQFCRAPPIFVFSNLIAHWQSTDGRLSITARVTPRKNIMSLQMREWREGE